MNEEEARESTVTFITACTEVAKHSLDPADFITDIGRKDEYKGSEVLDWLGY